MTTAFPKDPAVEPAAIIINLGARLILIGQLVGKCAALKPIEGATDLMQWSSDWPDEDSQS